MKRVPSFKLKGLCAGLCLALLSLALAAPASASGGAQASYRRRHHGQQRRMALGRLHPRRRQEGRRVQLQRLGHRSQLVLTAGHCVEDIVTGRKTPLPEYAVVTGSSDVRDATLRQVSKSEAGDPLPRLQSLQGPWRRRAAGARDADHGAALGACHRNRRLAAGCQHANLDRGLGALWTAAETEADPGPAPRCHLRSAAHLLPQPRPRLLPLLQLLLAALHDHAAGLLDRDLPRRQRWAGTRLPRRRHAGADRHHQPRRRRLRHPPARHLHPGRQDLPAGRRNRSPRRRRARPPRSIFKLGIR